ncbi:MAG: hypothetical protein LBN22_00590 [Clostridiales Family XIII bacterium]|nr:hypothetical protein [Clostridiales Family XIII bacterium]
MSNMTNATNPTNPKEGKNLKTWAKVHSKQVVIAALLVVIIAAALIVGITRSMEKEKLKEPPATGKVYSASSDVTVDLSKGK